MPGWSTPLVAEPAARLVHVLLHCALHSQTHAFLVIAFGLDGSASPGVLLSTVPPFVGASPAAAVVPCLGLVLLLVEQVRPLVGTLLP